MKKYTRSILEELSSIDRSSNKDLLIESSANSQKTMMFSSLLTKMPRPR